MSLIGNLLTDVLNDVAPAATEVAAVEDVSCPRWVSDTIRSPHGVLALAKAGVADDVDAVVRVAAALCRRRHQRLGALAHRLGMSISFVKKVAHALTHRLGLGRLGKSWAPEEAPGSYRGVIVWNGARHWLTIVSLQLITPAGKATIARRKSTRAMVMRVARQDAAVADGRNGRNVRTSHQTVGSRIGFSSEAVRHARYVLEDLGLSTTVIGGRYLTAAERAEARATHGGWQRRIASTRALTLPRHLPRRGSVPAQPSVTLNSPRRASKSPKPRTSPKLPKLSLGFQRLAAQVAIHLPHLAQSHIGNLARALARLPIDPTEWTGHALLHLIQVSNRERGLSQPEHRGNGIGLLIHQIRTALAR